MNKHKNRTPQQLENIREKYANKGCDEYGLFEIIKAKDNAEDNKQEPR